MEIDVLIIGAGPAGLTTAFETASRGLTVTLVDESVLVGGQLQHQTQIIKSLPFSLQAKRGFEIVKVLKDRLKDFPILYLLEHRVIGVYADGSVGITDNTHVSPVKAKKIIVATGAAENAIPFPKWTLPGVMTIGAAQRLVNRDFVMPGSEAIIVGSSDFAMDVALQLIEVGVNIKGIVESQSQIKVRNKDKVREVESKGVPIYLNSTIIEARGREQIEEIVLKLQDKILTEKVDLVCVDGGRIPIPDLFYQLGCSFGYQEELGGWIPQYNRYFQTNIVNIFLAGNAAGISSLGGILITSKIAGISVCEALNVISNEEAKKIRRTLWTELEVIEKSLELDVWKGRQLHIENFTKPILQDQFFD